MLKFKSIVCLKIFVCLLKFKIRKLLLSSFKKDYINKHLEFKIVKRIYLIKTRGVIFLYYLTGKV